MCWSTKVSLLFGLFDLAVIITLLVRNVGRDRTYAIFLAPILCQEICQMILWASHAPSATICLRSNRVFSFLAVLSAQMVPFVPLLLGNHHEQRKLRIVGYVMYVIQATILWVSVFLTNSWCVLEGPNHHQIWISDQALYRLGGAALYHATLSIYTLATVCGVLSLKLPLRETVGFHIIGLGTFLINFAIYAATLEACSVWCWSGSAFGVYMLIRPLPKASLESNKAA